MHPPAEPTPTWIRSLAGLLEATRATDRAGAKLPLPEALARAASLIGSAKADKLKVMAVGNGGSAAIASHLHTDLCHSLGLRALVFNEPPLLTAQTNDHGYENAFSNLVALWADPDDVLVAISSSGRSRNILNAAVTARDKGMRLVTFSGFAPDNPLAGLGDLNFHVPSSAYGPVETAHGTLLHHITDLVLAALSSEASR